MTSPSTPLLAAAVLFCSISSALCQTDSLAQSDEYHKLGLEVFNYMHRKQATELFTLATQWNPKNARAQLMAGKSIMLTVNKENSLPYFKKAFALDQTIDEEILFLIGKAHHYSEHYDSAILFYERYNRQLARSLRLDKSNKITEVNKKIFECRNAIVFMQNPADVTITHLSDKVNSEYPDYAPAIIANESMLFFTSRRPDQNLNVKMAEDLEYFEEILYSTLSNGEWQPAKALPPPINTEYHNSCIAISPDGTEMILYTDENGGDLLISYRKSGVWSAPQPMIGINTEHIENSAAFSADNKFLFFTSNRPGGYGGTDIYKAELGTNGRWSKVQNLGPKVNTELDEEGVFISVSGKHLYFSSNGHPGMGDLDLYRTALDPATGLWGEPVNLGYPINSPENDIYFVLNADETVAYFSSVRTENIGEQDIYRVDMKRWKGIETKTEDLSDLYKFKPLPIPQKEETQPATLMTDVTINLAVLDAGNREKLNAKVLLGGNNTQTEFTKRMPGQYTTLVKSSSTNPLIYKILVSNQGYIPQTSTLYVGGFSTTSVTLTDTVLMQKIPTDIAPSQIQTQKQTQPASNPQPTSIKDAKINIPVRLEIFFAHDSDVPLSFDGVQEIITLMKNSPTMKVELGGHTDKNGDEVYNKQLSQRRADAVKNYLVKKGVTESQIVAIGYGSSKQVDATNTIEARRRNRRTEFTILEK